VPDGSRPLADDEAVWIERLRRSEPDAERWYVERHREGLYRAAVYFLGFQDPDAEDVVQEALLQGLKRLETFEGRSRLGTWLNQICVHLCYRRVRQRQRLAVAAGDDLRALLAPSSREQGPDALGQLLDAERLAALRQGLEAMGEPCREIVRRRDIDGQAYAEAAAQMKLPMGTFMSRLARCRQRLKHEVQRLWQKGKR
jgi:RNA polymerase sigma-70 factor (ECF subfamily)